MHWGVEWKFFQRKHTKGNIRKCRKENALCHWSPGKCMFKARACMFASVLSHFSRVWLFAALWTVAHQAVCSWFSPGHNTGVVAISPSRGFSPPRNWTNISCCSCITGRFLLQSLQGSPCESTRVIKNNNRRQELLMRMSDPCTELLEMQNNSTAMEMCMKILKRIKNRTNLPVLPSIPPVRMKMNRKIPVQSNNLSDFHQNAWDAPTLSFHPSIHLSYGIKFSAWIT